MRHFSKITTILGGLALAAMFALSSPGVRIARATDDVAADEGEGAVCEAGTIRGAGYATAYLQEVDRLQAEQDIAPRSDDGVIVLNNRGFNYDRAGYDFPRADELDGR